MNPFVAKNRDLWDEWAEINYRSKFYDVEGFKTKRPPLDDVVRTALGDLRGKRVLHLQCHFGLDTLRIADEADEVIGVDFSPKAIALARDLAFELGSSARFVESDVYALSEVLHDQFDIVFASYGVLHWLPSLVHWGQIVERYLVPGGRFVLVDAHPAVMMLDADADAPRIAYGYFHTAEPIRVGPRTGNYADSEATYSNTEHSWQHELSSVVMALLGVGLRLDELREYPFATWRALAFLVETAPEHWTVPAGVPQLPLMFTLRASKR